MQSSPAKNKKSAANPLKSSLLPRLRLDAFPAPANEAQSPLIVEQGYTEIDVLPSRKLLLWRPNAPVDQAQVPALLLLHGHGGQPLPFLKTFECAHENRSVAILAPKSLGRSWDAIRGEPGPDLHLIDQGLQRLFDQIPIDPKRIGIAGFSDGASYALMLALANPDLFTHVVAFSPCYLPAIPRRDLNPTTRFFIAHGSEDRVLPERCGRQVADRLARAGYDTQYTEYCGGHVVPSVVACQAVEWFLKAPPASAERNLNQKGIGT